MEVPGWYRDTSIDDAVAFVLREILAGGAITVHDSVSYNLSAEGMSLLFDLWAIPAATRLEMYVNFRGIYDELRDAVLTWDLGPRNSNAEAIYKLWSPVYEALGHALLIHLARRETSAANVTLDYESTDLEPGGAYVRFP